MEVEQGNSVQNKTGIMKLSWIEFKDSLKHLGVDINGNAIWILGEKTFS